MKKVFNTFLKRPVKNYNVQEKAQKVLDKNKESKPETAPKHQSSLKYIEKYMEEHPEILEAQKTKDGDLLKRLEGMVVNPDKVGEINLRPLPANRTPKEETEFGFFEPEKIPEGKCTLRTALTFISEHSSNPKEVTDEQIARKYNLDVTQVKNVLSHFQTFELQIPKDPTKYKSDSSATKMLVTEELKKLSGKIKGKE